MKDTKNTIKKVLKGIVHPEVNHTLFDLGMVKNMDIQEGKIVLTLKLPMLDIPIKGHLITDIKSAVKGEDGNIKVEVNIEEMDEKERARFMKMAQEAWRG